MYVLELFLQRFFLCILKRCVFIFLIGFLLFIPKCFPFIIIIIIIIAVKPSIQVLGLSSLRLSSNESTQLSVNILLNGFLLYIFLNVFLLYIFLNVFLLCIFLNVFLLYIFLNVFLLYIFLNVFLLYIFLITFFFYTYS